MRRRKDNNLFWSFVRFSIVPVIIIFVFMLVWLKSEVTSLEYRISEHEKERMDLLEQKKELIVKRSDLLSVKNIEYVAMKKLGLTFPDRKRVIYVKRGDMPHNFKAGLDLPVK
ncbi:MAG TPA: hypothetical protein ENG80_02045, partial [Nitrospirae bacterium]|nr:cell division protein FtsL [bacterium BMS3Bbin05]HDH00575.1 hypothetical protein [Nitrospirota bacterium]HDL20529.1 hypothetical protein [Nitrospirota bacterium]HDO21848.1 hypothetical protein [Nitrospirota bacterium]HDZ87163.1 hypothetical protein [Nitrospirota bacterium]